MSLETPVKIRMLQRKLYQKAKDEPSYRFYLLYDKKPGERVVPAAAAEQRRLLQVVIEKAAWQHSDSS